MNRSEIEQRATDVLRDHDLLSIPVDPLRVARSLGIKVMNAVFSEGDKSGAAVKREKGVSILLDTNDAPSRKRFTIAHELGHCLLHMGNDEDADIVDTGDSYRSAEPSVGEGWTVERTREWEANVFAAALLMNEELVRSKWCECSDPALMAWMFQVSLQAMAVRLAQLGLVENLP